MARGDGGSPQSESRAAAGRREGGRLGPEAGGRRQSGGDLLVGGTGARRKGRVNIDSQKRRCWWWRTELLAAGRCAVLGRPLPGRPPALPAPCSQRTLRGTRGLGVSLHVTKLRTKDSLPMCSGPSAWGVNLGRVHRAFCQSAGRSQSTARWFRDRLSGAGVHVVEGPGKSEGSISAFPP